MAAMSRVFLTVALAASLVLVPTQVLADAQTAEGCQPGEVPHFTSGFAALKDQIGDAMGDPITCEFTDPSGTGDVHQRTSTGLAFWRKSTNTPTFTDGFNHWAQTPQGWVTWTGGSVDPPTASANAYPDILVQAFVSGCRNADPTNPALGDTCSCAIQKIQTAYTLADFLNISTNYLQTGAFPSDVTALIASCV
jgi:hypothetical protein